jgi:hypothetical protein
MNVAQMRLFMCAQNVSIKRPSTLKAPVETGEVLHQHMSLLSTTMQSRQQRDRLDPPSHLAGDPSTLI